MPPFLLRDPVLTGGSVAARESLARTTSSFCGGCSGEEPEEGNGEGGLVPAAMSEPPWPTKWKTGREDAGKDKEEAVKEGEEVGVEERESSGALTLETRGWMALSQACFSSELPAEMRKVRPEVMSWKVWRRPEDSFSWEVARVAWSRGISPFHLRTVGSEPSK